jgi:3-methyl-2-oxobutanoate hydroxymethyltransferase
MPDKVTAPKVRAMKAGGQKVVCVTAYDAVFGRLADEAGVDVILVGDSVANVLLGYRDTLGVTLEEMGHHVRATRAGVERALLVADLPFGSYGASAAQAVESAAYLMKRGAEAVKLEGDFAEEVEAIARTGVPVMGHVGMTPQSVHRFGGFRVQGRGGDGDAVVEAAKRLDAAGAFAIVLELVPRDLAARITAEVSCPTIGIGAGVACDGQIQVAHDVLGLSKGVFRHAKRYADGGEVLREGLREYAREVRERSFPAEDHSF